MPLRKKTLTKQRRSVPRSLKALSGKDYIIIQLSKRQNFAWVIEQLRRELPTKKNITYAG